MFVQLGEKLPKHYRMSFKKVRVAESLQIKHDCVKYGIDTNLMYSLDYVDLQSLLYIFHLEKLNTTLYEISKQKLNERGISRIEKASEDDFNSL